MMINRTVWRTNVCTFLDTFTLDLGAVGAIVDRFGTGAYGAALQNPIWA